MALLGCLAGFRVTFASTGEVYMVQSSFSFTVVTKSVVLRWTLGDLEKQLGGLAEPVMGCLGCHSKGITKDYKELWGRFGKHWGTLGGLLTRCGAFKRNPKLIFADRWNH